MLPSILPPPPAVMVEHDLHRTHGFEHRILVDDNVHAAVAQKRAWSRREVVADEAEVLWDAARLRSGG